MSPTAQSLFEKKKVLFIAAHPDDVEFYCGGLVYMMRKLKIEVHYAIATRGGRGKPAQSAARLEALRTKHQMNAAFCLGGAQVKFFEYPDGNLSSHVEAFAADLKSLIADTEPDAILSWDPDYTYNPNPDHVAAAQSGRLAADPSMLYYYGTTRPDTFVGLDSEALSAKFSAICEHKTEVPWYYYHIMKFTILRRLRKFGKLSGVKYAEGFRCEAPDV